ncbi:MAG: hypothetical protein HQK77_05210 [Desulfobacterales bacterium]|nr:hypothetical protein [Desulfobacterales bacterium]
MMKFWQKFGEQRRRDRFLAKEQVFVMVNPFDSKLFPVYDLSLSGASFYHNLHQEERIKEQNILSILCDRMIFVERVPYKIISDDPAITDTPFFQKRRVRFGALTLDQIQKISEIIVYYTISLDIA